VTTEGRTLLPQYLGTYRLTVNNAETYWIVMTSIFSSSVRMHRKFDLKGSTVDRQASTKEKVCWQLYIHVLDLFLYSHNIIHVHVLYVSDFTVLHISTCTYMYSHVYWMYSKIYSTFTCYATV